MLHCGKLAHSLLKNGTFFAEKCFSDEFQKNVLVILCGDQSSAAVDVACWPVTGCTVTTDPASAQEPIMAYEDNMTLFPSELSHCKQYSQPSVINSYNDGNFNLFMYYFG